MLRDHENESDLKIQLLFCLLNEPVQTWPGALFFAGFRCWFPSMIPWITISFSLLCLFWAERDEVGTALLSHVCVVVQDSLLGSALWGEGVPAICCHVIVITWQQGALDLYAESAFSCFLMKHYLLPENVLSFNHAYGAIALTFLNNYFYWTFCSPTKMIHGIFWRLLMNSWIIYTVHWLSMTKLVLSKVRKSSTKCRDNLPLVKVHSSAQFIQVMWC